MHMRYGLIGGLQGSRKYLGGREVTAHLKGGSYPFYYGSGEE